MYNLKNELNMNPVRWSLIFTIARGLRLLHDVRLLSKPTQSEQYAKELWLTMLTVLIKNIYLHKKISFFFYFCRK
jgi:hypothetical protein